MKDLTSGRLNNVAAYALNAIFQNWIVLGLNQQLITVLNWILKATSSHPYNIGDNAFGNIAKDGQEYKGAWSGVGCTPTLRVYSAKDTYYDVSVTTLQ